MLSRGIKLKNQHKYQGKLVENHHPADFTADLLLMTMQRFS
jgi:hypothetical protein